MSHTYDEIFARNLLLLGRERVDKLKQSHVIVCGVGGVGSYVVEALVRSGIGALTLVDADKVALSNLNRQLPALLSTLDQPKVEVVAARIAEINPDCRLQLQQRFIEPEQVALVGVADYLVDAIDYLPGKLALVQFAKQQGMPVISAMGAGLRLAPEKLRLDDISRTHTCPLARRMRKGLRELGIKDGVPVVFSEETPQPSYREDAPAEEVGWKSPLGSSAFVPAAAGLLMASYVVRQLTESGR